MEKEIFILTAHRDHEADASSTEVVGAFLTHEKAYERMLEAVDEEVGEWCDNGECLGFIDIKSGDDYEIIKEKIDGLKCTEFSITKVTIEESA
jgi:fructose 1,6-bisphosphatase